MFTNLWHDNIGYINQVSTKLLTTTNANAANIWRAAQNVYKGYPALLEAVQHTILAQ